jgi:hypothetical protein
MGTGKTGRGLASFGTTASCLLLVFVAFVVPLSQSAMAAEPTRSLIGSFGPDGTSATGFTSVGSIAVDQGTGAVYVLDYKAGNLYKFDENGNPVAFGGAEPYIAGNRLEGLAPNEGPGESQVAVDSASHVIYVTEKHSVRAFQENGEPYVFSAGPGAGTSELPAESALGVAVDVNGDIYVSDFSLGEVLVYEPSGGLVTKFPSGVQGNANVAVDSSGTVYVAAFVGVFTVTPDTFPVSETTIYSTHDLHPAQPFNKKASRSVATDPASDDVYIAETDSEAHAAQYEPSGHLLVRFGEGQLPNISGIAVNEQTENAFVGANPEGGELPQVRIFGPAVFPSAAPTIEDTFAVNITADSAGLRAGINPNSHATTYYFEYGEADCSISECAQSAPIGNEIPTGFNGVLVATEIGGLAAGTTYHYRVVAKNSLGTTMGPDRTFTTQNGAGDFKLSDSRVWELVSPSNKGGAFLAGSAKGVIQAAADGEALTYLSVGPLEGDPEGNRVPEVASALAHRAPAGTWNSRDLTPPNDRVSGVAAGSLGEYKLFTADLTKALLEPRSGTPLSAQASERTPYLAENLESPVFTPLVTGKAGYENVPPGTVFGGDPNAVIGPIRIAGASPDFTHVVLVSEAPLAPDDPTPALYEWNGEQIRPLSVLPAVPADESGTFVSARVIGSGAGSVQGAISENGERVFWSSGEYFSSEESLTALYLRDTAAEETSRLDIVQPGASGDGQDNPIFQGASADGSVVYFTDARQLTAGASSEGRDLYRCEIPQGPNPEGCASLVDISAPLTGSGDSSEVQGVVSGLSDSGGDVSFVAKGVLDASPNDEGETATSGEPNLYHWRMGAGVRFIATLSNEDDRPDWGKRIEDNFAVAVGGILSAAGSPDGRYLAFMSSRSLTGYSNQDSVSEARDQEVFRYDADTDTLACVSCNPSGASPRGDLLNTAPGIAGSLIDPLEQWQGRPLAALLPEATMRNIPPAPSFYRPRTVLDNGRIYFNSFDSLVPADSNGNWDVYQYEPTGTGSCTTTGGPAVARSGDACVSLVSSGTAEEEAGFLDSSTSGDDVFFLSPARLSVLDNDNLSDVYDARVNGVEAKISPDIECGGEECQSPASPPSDSTPASATYNGAGNVKARCAKGKRLVKRAGKSRCVRRKHRAHEKHHKRHHTHTGANSARGAGR